MFHTMYNMWILTTICLPSGPIKAFSVWVGDEECLEITNPYVAGTPSLDVTRKVINCYSQLPYICVKEEQELTTRGIFYPVLGIGLHIHLSCSQTL